MTFWRNVLPNMLLLGQNAVLVVKKTLQNFYQCDLYQPKQKIALTTDNKVEGGQ